MTFTQRFPPFVCEGDSITCEVAGFEITARIVRDDCPDAPDAHQDGFWPSLYEDAPGFIGPGPNPRQRFADAQAKAESVMEAWRNDEWFYCAIVLSVTLGGVTLDTHAASLCGIEANYPGSDNAYLTQVAQELLSEALDAGHTVLAALKEHADSEMAREALVFDVSFATVTQESAEMGDYASSGFVCEGVTLGEAITAVTEVGDDQDFDLVHVDPSCNYGDFEWVTVARSKQVSPWDEFSAGEVLCVERSVHFPKCMTRQARLRVLEMIRARA